MINTQTSLRTLNTSLKIYNQKFFLLEKGKKDNSNTATGTIYANKYKVNNIDIDIANANKANKLGISITNRDEANNLAKEIADKNKAKNLKKDIPNAQTNQPQA